MRAAAPLETGGRSLRGQRARRARNDAPRGGVEVIDHQGVRIAAEVRDYAIERPALHAEIEPPHRDIDPRVGKAPPHVAGDEGLAAQLIGLQVEALLHGCEVHARHLEAGRQVAREGHYPRTQPAPSASARLPRPP